MSARLTITLSYTTVWLLFLACLMALPAHADRYDRGAGERGFHWRDILRDAARDEAREYRFPRRAYRRDEPRQVYHRDERLPQEPRSVPGTQGMSEGIQEGIETALSSPRRVVLHPLMVFSRPPGSSGESQDAVYTGKAREMVYARLSREYRYPNGTNQASYIEFTGRGGERVSGWVDERYLSNFQPQDDPWMAEFVTEGTIMTNPTTNPLSHAISSNVSIGTLAKVVGYTSTDQGTWYLLEDPASRRLRGWTSGTEIQKAGFLEERARQAAAERERQLLLEQQQREEAAAREREELERQRLIAQQQEEQRAADQARLEREQQQQAYERLRQEQARQEWGAILRQAPLLLLTFYLFFGTVAAFVPRYRSYWDERAGGGVGQFLWGGKLLSLLALGAFTWMVFSGIRSSDQASLALVFGLIGLPAMLFAPWLLITFAQYLHYLFVPHLAEKHLGRIVRASRPGAGDVAGVSRAFYDPLRDGLPSAWQAENRRKRIEAASRLMESEVSFMERLRAYLKKKLRGEGR